MTTLSILGGGNGGQTLAADSALRGDFEEVRLYEHPDFAASSLGPALETNEIELGGEQINYEGVSRRGTAEIDVVTTEMESAVTGADLVVVVVPAVAHPPFFEALAPLLADGQVVGILPENYGSLRLRVALDEIDHDPDVVIGGWDTLGYGSRLVEPGSVDCMVRGYRLRYDSLPSSDAGRFFEAMRELPNHDSCQYVDHIDTVLAVGLANFNPIIHVPGSVLNVGAMEVATRNEGVVAPNEEWSLYKHGMSPAISRVQWQVYKEIRAVTDAIGIQLPQLGEEQFFEEHSVATVSYDAPSYYESDITSITGPDSVEHRYFTEDIPYGIMMAANLADRFGVAVPTLDALVWLGSVICERDFVSGGLSLAEVGLVEYDRAELLEFLRGK